MYTHYTFILMRNNIHQIIENDIPNVIEYYELFLLLKNTITACLC